MVRFLLDPQPRFGEARGDPLRVVRNEALLGVEQLGSSRVVFRKREQKEPAWFDDARDLPKQSRRLDDVLQEPRGERALEARASANGVSVQSATCLAT